MNLANHRTSIILAIVFATLLSSFWFFQDFAFIVFLSLLLQLLLQPAVDAMERRRIAGNAPAPRPQRTKPPP